MFRRLNLAGIGGADRGNFVGIEDAGLQVVDLSIELKARRVEMFPPELAMNDLFLGKDPLIAEIVNRLH